MDAGRIEGLTVLPLPVDELFIGSTTVRTHIYRLRVKLGMKDRAQLVSFAYQYGLTAR